MANDYHTNSERMIDLPKAGVVEVSIDDTGKFWLNIDGKCVIRIGKVTDRLVYETPGITHTALQDET